MRILFVSHSFPVPNQPLSNVGGMQRVAVELYQALDADPDIELSSLLLETSWRWTGIRTPGFLLRLLNRIPSIVREKEIEVVLFSSMVTASVTALLQRRIREAGAITAAIPVGRDVTLPNPLYQRLVPNVLRQLDLVFPISRATAEAVLERGTPAERVHVVPCGVDLPRMTAPSARPDARASLVRTLRGLGHEVDADALLLLSVGRHQERKGFHWFVEEVVPRLDPGVQYLLAGSGPMTKAVQAAVERRKLESRVVLLGQVSEELLGELYRGADLFVMPNVRVAGDIEGFGVVMLEAGASGLPVVAADLEGIRDVITEGVNGSLVPSRDVAGFISAIEGHRDPRERAERSARAAAHVRETFGWPAVVHRYVGILSERVGRSAAEKAEAAA